MLKMMPAQISVFPVKATICRELSSPVLVSVCRDNIITYSVDNSDPDNTYPVYRLNWYRCWG